jgi:hypothetical protein
MEKLTDLIKNHPENPVNPVKKKNLPKGHDSFHLSPISYFLVRARLTRGL